MSADSANTSADLAVKIREDPLFVIRQREEEAKKRIASNPIKLRKLKQVHTLGNFSKLAFYLHVFENVNNFNIHGIKFNISKNRANR